MDLSTRLPATVKLEGFDISLEATTLSGHLPPNVSFRKWDIKQSPPEDLVGQYDIVHIRLLIFVLLDDDIPKILQNLPSLR